MCVAVVRSPNGARSDHFYVQLFISPEITQDPTQVLHNKHFLLSCRCRRCRHSLVAGAWEQSHRDITVVEFVRLLPSLVRDTVHCWDFARLWIYFLSFYLIENSPCRYPSALFLFQRLSFKKAKTRKRVNFPPPDVVWQIIDTVREHSAGPPNSPL